MWFGPNTTQLLFRVQLIQVTIPSKLVIACVQDFLCSRCADLKPSYWAHHMFQVIQLTRSHHSQQIGDSVCSGFFLCSRQQRKRNVNTHEPNVNSNDTQIKHSQTHGKHTMRTTSTQKLFLCSSTILLVSSTSKTQRQFAGLVQVKAWRRSLPYSCVVRPKQTHHQHQSITLNPLFRLSRYISLRKEYLEDLAIISVSTPLSSLIFVPGCCIPSPGNCWLYPLVLITT